MKVNALYSLLALFALSACDDDDNDDDMQDASLPTTDAAAKEDSAPVVEKDETPPTVSFDRPGKGELFTGDVTVKVLAEDNVAVTKVVLESEGQELTTLTEAPYQWTWAMGDRINGPYWLKATAYDAAGLSATAETKFNYEKACSENCPPRKLSFEAPASNASICGTSVLLGASKENQGLKSITYSLGEQAIGTISEFPWFASVDTTLFPDGPAQLRAVFTDKNDQSAAHVIDVTIANQGNCNQAPTIEIAYPEEGETVKEEYWLHTRAKDAEDQVMRVTFYLDGEFLKDITTSPYRYKWDSTTVADGDHVLWVRVDDRDGNINFAKRNFKVDQSYVPPEPTPDEPSEK